MPEQTSRVPLRAYLPLASLLLIVFLASTRATAAKAAATAPPSYPAPAANPAPAAPPAAAGRFDETALRRGAGAGAERSADGPAAQGSNGPAVNSQGYDLPRVVLALSAVVGLIFLLRWAARKFFALPNAQGSSKAVQVLSRNVLSAKQHLVIVKVGRRLLVASDNGSQLSPLSEITDPDEVASLVGQLRSEKDANPLAGSPAKAFNTLFGHLKKVYDRGREAAGLTDLDGESEEEDSTPADRTPHDDGNGPNNRNGDSHGRGYDHDGDEPEYVTGRAGADVFAPRGHTDANVVAASSRELTGLLAKVRLVSDQFEGPQGTRKGTS